MGDSLTQISEGAIEAANGDAAISQVATESHNGQSLVAVPERYVSPRRIVVESKPKITLTAPPADQTEIPA